MQNSSTAAQTADKWSAPLLFMICEDTNCGHIHFICSKVQWQPGHSKLLLYLYWQLFWLSPIMKIVSWCRQQSVRAVYVDQGLQNDLPGLYWSDQIQFWSGNWVFQSRSEAFWSWRFRFRFGNPILPETWIKNAAFWYFKLKGRDLNDFDAKIQDRLDCTSELDLR